MLQEYFIKWLLDNYKVKILIHQVLLPMKDQPPYAHAIHYDYIIVDVTDINIDITKRILFESRKGFEHQSDAIDDALIYCLKYIVKY